jgi:hypothetical protein
MFISPPIENTPKLSNDHAKIVDQETLDSIINENSKDTPSNMFTQEDDTTQRTRVKRSALTPMHSISDMSKRRPPRYLDSITSDQFYKRFKKVRNGAKQSREASIDNQQSRNAHLSKRMESSGISQDGSSQFI